ncbi:DUF3052 domain-containing protein [Roseivirga misakiensis]|uniref:DUF3052 domain-containing protein n=1 Tax=Roseivirga misakiensis TaxID=1563681 RepID=A0A1E5T4Z1_9BACT|nr:DUF3052 domain-containing protein [Roseivirga misakiensis]OEK06444.1 DUF3052 domain-containing protein [Roseivirga misakiensis]
MTTAGYSGTPLAKKLGIKHNFKCHFIHIPEYYFNLFQELPEIEDIEAPTQESLDFAHIFLMSQEEMNEIVPGVKDYLKKTGTLWLSWPKKASKLKTDLDGNVIRTFGLDNGLVDVKVAAVDDIWSGLKFMYRVKDR